MSIDAEVSASTDLLGKSVTDLQSDIVIGDIAIGGVSHYVDDYTGYSGDPDLQSGNYLALHASADEGATIKVILVGGEDDERTLDSDGLVVARLTDEVTGIKFTATKDSKTETRTLSLVSLVLEEED